MVRFKKRKLALSLRSFLPNGPHVFAATTQLNCSLITLRNYHNASQLANNMRRQRAHLRHTCGRGRGGGGRGGDDSVRGQPREKVLVPGGPADLGPGPATTGRRAPPSLKPPCGVQPGRGSTLGRICHPAGGGGMAQSGAW